MTQDPNSQSAEHIAQVFNADGYKLAKENIDNPKSLLSVFAGMQQVYGSISQLTQSFAQKSILEKKPIACKKGCEWCCHQAVFMNSYEAMLVSYFLKQQKTKKEMKELTIKAEAKLLATTKAAIKDNTTSVKMACPFLENGACSIYPVRPMACRIYLSSDEKSCKKKFDEPENKTHYPALFDFILKAGQNINEGFASFLKEQGKEIMELSIESFLMKIDKEPDFPLKWEKQ